MAGPKPKPSRAAQAIRSKFGDRRRAAVLVAVLVSLLVVTLLATALLRTLFVRQRQMQLHEQQIQALWLAESGTDRAAVQLHDSADYQGETWRVPAGELDGEHDGLVVIRAEPVADAPNQRRMIIEANYPDDPIHRTRHSKQLLMTIPREGGQP